MAYWKFEGMDAWIDNIYKLAVHYEDIASEIIYDGAGVVADAIRSEINGLPINKRGEFHKEMKGITSSQKQGLQMGLGIASMNRKGGNYNRIIGFAGYNRTRTDKFPHGQPNAMIARSVNNGTYFRTATHFVDRAVRRSKAQAEQAMSKQADIQFKKYGGE